MSRPHHPLRAVLGVTAAAALALLAGCGVEDAEPTTAAPSEASIESAVIAAEEYRQTGDYPEAIAILTVLLDRAPESAVAWETLAQVRIAEADALEHTGGDPRGVREAAADAYVRAAACAPNAAETQHNAAVVAMIAGRPAVAVTHFDRAHELEPLVPRHLLYAAQALSALQRFTDAEIALEKVLAIDPDEPYAYATLALIALERGDTDLARERIAEAREIAPRDPGIRLHAARIARETGDPAGGAALLQSFAPAILVRDHLVDELVACLDAAGTTGAAQRVLAEASALSPQPRWLHDLGLRQVDAAALTDAAATLARLERTAAPDAMVRELRQQLRRAAGAEAPGDDDDA